MEALGDALYFAILDKTFTAINFQLSLVRVYSQLDWKTDNAVVCVASVCTVHNVERV